MVLCAVAVADRVWRRPALCGGGCRDKRQPGKAEVSVWLSADCTRAIRLWESAGLRLLSLRSGGRRQLLVIVVCQPAVLCFCMLTWGGGRLAFVSSFS